jgi:uncharacterized protein YjbJ (UPF0337 family)
MLSKGAFPMNWTQVEGKWEEVKGDAKAKWAKLTDDDLKAVGGQLDRLTGKIVERYGVKKEQAQKDIEDWVNRIRAKLDSLGGQAGERSEDSNRNGVGY